MSKVCLPFWKIKGFGPHWFKPQSSGTNNLTIYTCHFLARRLALLGGGKDWLAQCPDNESGKSSHGAGGLVSQWSSTIKLP